MNILFPALALMILTSGSALFHPVEKVPTRSHEKLNPYAIASAMSGAPEKYLEAIASVESDGGRNLAHINPVDRGWFGLHELPEYHEERARLYGDYSADDPIEAGRIAGRILMDHFYSFDSWDMAFTAYHRGAGWVLRNGVDWEYAIKIKEAING